MSTCHFKEPVLHCMAFMTNACKFFSHLLFLSLFSVFFFFFSRVSAPCLNSRCKCFFVFKATAYDRLWFVVIMSQLRDVVWPHVKHAHEVFISHRCHWKQRRKWSSTPPFCSHLNGLHCEMYLKLKCVTVLLDIKEAVCYITTNKVTYFKQTNVQFVVTVTFRFWFLSLLFLFEMDSHKWFYILCSD